MLVYKDFGFSDKYKNGLMSVYEYGYRCRNNKFINIFNNNELKTRLSEEGYIEVTVHFKYFNGGDGDPLLLNDWLSGTMNINIKLHRLLALEKFGLTIFQSDMEVRHLNGIKTDLNWDNISIGTHLENMLDIPIEIRRTAMINAWNNMSEETKLNRSKKLSESLTHDQRSAISKKAMSEMTPEARSDRTRKAMATVGFDRLSLKMKTMHQERSSEEKLAINTKGKMTYFLEHYGSDTGCQFSRIQLKEMYHLQDLGILDRKELSRRYNCSIDTIHKTIQNRETYTKRYNLDI